MLYLVCFVCHERGEVYCIRRTKKKNEGKTQYQYRIYYLPGRIELVELHAEVRGVCPRVDRETDLESGKGDPLHDAAPEVAELGDGLDRSLGEHVKRERLVWGFWKPGRNDREKNARI